MEDYGNTNNNGGVQRTPDEPKMGLIQKITGVIVSPTVAMKSIAAWPNVLWPILFVSVVPFILAAAKYPVYLEYFKKMLAVRLQGSAALPADAAALTLNIAMITTLAGTLIGGLLMWVVTSAILMGFMKLFSGQGKFSQYLTVTGYANIIVLIVTLLGTFMAYFTHNLQFDISLSYFAQTLLKGTEKTFIFGFMYTILAAVSLFRIWYYVVLAIGIAAVSKVNKKIVYAIVFCGYILLVLAGALISGFSEASAGSISSTLL